MSKEILNISSSLASPGKGIVYDTQKKMHDIMSTPILYQELLFADRNTNVHCIGGWWSLSIDRIAWKWIDAYDPSKKYVEHILFRPDNEEGTILRRQKIIQELLPTDFWNTKELLTQWVHSFSRLEYFQSQYYDIDLEDEEKKEVLDEACQILESLFKNTQVAIAEIRTKENISLWEIIEDFSRHFERVFPEQNIILHADEPQKLFEYIPKLRWLYEAIIRFRALLTVLAYIRASHMNPVEFAEESVWYTNARSIFLDDEKNVPASSFPDIPLILLRAPNGSGKSFAQERDMAIQILWQSIGFVPADHPRLRIYDTIWMQSRLQSVQHTSSDLSALGVEWQSLDTLYNTIVEAPWKKVLLYLDETWATTDEKSEHTIMRCFIDSIRRISPEGRIRFSTHNQPLIDAMRWRKDSNIWFYTFTHEHKLEVGERNSDTIRSMKHLFERINTTIYEYCKSGQYSLFSDEIEDFLKRLMWWEFSSKYKKQELMKVWEEFSQFAQGILEELECYERWEMTELGRWILHTQKNSHPIHFSREQQALLASRSKWIWDNIFSPTNWRSDYQISSVHHPMWKTPRKTMIGRKWRIHDHFYEDSNYPIDSRSEDHFSEARIGKEPEYDWTDIWYTNTGWDVSEARSHIRLSDVKKNPSRREEMFHQIYSRVSTLNIPLTQEKGSMLAELQNRRDAVDKLISHGDTLCDIIRVFIVMRAELAKDFRDKQFMWEGGFLGRLHANLTYTDPESYRNKTDCMELLEHENDFEHLYDYRVHQLLYWYELIRTLYLLAHGEKDFLWELDRYVQEYNEMFLWKNFSDKTVHLNKAIKQSLIDLLKNHIPRLLEKWWDETLGEILGRDYYDCLIECKDLKRDQEQFWSFALRFIAKHQNDTTNYLTEFLSLLESFKSPPLTVNRKILQWYSQIFIWCSWEYTLINTVSYAVYNRTLTKRLSPILYSSWNRENRWVLSSGASHVWRRYESPEYDRRSAILASEHVGNKSWYRRVLGSTQFLDFPEGERFLSRKLSWRKRTGDWQNEKPSYRR